MRLYWLRSVGKRGRQGIRFCQVEIDGSAVRRWWATNSLAAGLGGADDCSLGLHFFQPTSVFAVDVFPGKDAYTQKNMTRLSSGNGAVEALDGVER